MVLCIFGREAVYEESGFLSGSSDRSILSCIDEVTISIHRFLSLGAARVLSHRLKILPCRTFSLYFGHCI
jgi:hypothetical protein